MVLQSGAGSEEHGPINPFQEPTWQKFHAERRCLLKSILLSACSLLAKSMTSEIVKDPINDSILELETHVAVRRLCVISQLVVFSICSHVILRQSFC